MATKRVLLFFDFSPSVFSLSFPDHGKAGTKYDRIEIDK